MGGAFGADHQGGGHHAVEDGGGSPGSAAACRQRCWLLAARFLVGSAADLPALAERAAVWASAPGHLPPAPITPSCGRRPALPLATGWPALEHRRARLGQATTQPKVRERSGTSASWAALSVRPFRASDQQVVEDGVAFTDSAAACRQPRWLLAARSSHAPRTSSPEGPPAIIKTGPASATLSGRKTGHHARGQQITLDKRHAPSAHSVSSHRVR